MSHSPALRTFTLPSLSTVATSSSLEAKSNEMLDASFGSHFASIAVSSVSLSLTSRVSGTFNSFADTLTVMTQTSCISVSLTVAVISASPAATAVTVPVSSTVATLSSEEVHASVSFSAALAIFSSCAAVSAVADSPVAMTGVSAGASSVPKFTGSVMLSPFSRVAASGTEMFVTLTPHPTRLSAIAAVAITANAIFFFIIMEQDTPFIAVRLRWGGMRFLEKTKIQRFLLTSFQYLDDLYPCSRMANNLNFGNCY